MINEMHNSGNLNRSIIIVMSKKPGANGYKLYEAISLMSYISKVILGILMHRDPN